MTDDRDPTLQALFVDAETELLADDFTAAVMARLARYRQRTRRPRLIGAVVLIAIAVFAVVPLLALTSAVGELAAAPLIDLGQGLPAQLLAPVNSVTSIAALGFLLLRMVRKRLFA